MVQGPTAIPHLGTTKLLGLLVVLLVVLPAEAPTAVVAVVARVAVVTIPAGLLGNSDEIPDILQVFLGQLPDLLVH